MTSDEKAQLLKEKEELDNDVAVIREVINKAKKYQKSPNIHSLLAEIREMKQTIEAHSVGMKQGLDKYGVIIAQLSYFQQNSHRARPLFSILGSNIQLRQKKQNLLLKLREYQTNLTFFQSLNLRKLSVSGSRHINELEEQTKKEIENLRNLQHETFNIKQKILGQHILNGEKMIDSSIQDKLKAKLDMLNTLEPELKRDYNLIQNNRNEQLKKLRRAPFLLCNLEHDVVATEISRYQAIMDSIDRADQSNPRHLSKKYKKLTDDVMTFAEDVQNYILNANTMTSRLNYEASLLWHANVNDFKQRLEQTIDSSRQSLDEALVIKKDYENKINKICSLLGINEIGEYESIARVFQRIGPKIGELTKASKRGKKEITLTNEQLKLQNKELSIQVRKLANRKFVRNKRRK